MPFKPLILALTLFTVPVLADEELLKWTWYWQDPQIVDFCVGYELIAGVEVEIFNEPNVLLHNVKLAGKKLKNGAIRTLSIICTNASGPSPRTVTVYNDKVNSLAAPNYFLVTD